MLKDIVEYEKISSINRKRNELIPIIERLLFTDYDLSIEKNKAIVIASEFGRHDLVEKLLKDPRVDPSKTAFINEALFRAVSEGHEEVVRFLLQDGRVLKLSINHSYKEAVSKGSSRKRLVLRNLYKRIAKMLLDHGAEWRTLHTIFSKEMYEKEREDLINTMITSYLSIQEVSPKTILDGVEKNTIPKIVVKKIVYESVKLDLCGSNKSVPSMKLVALSKIFKIHSNSKTTKEQLCKEIERYLKYLR